MVEIQKVSNEAEARTKTSAIIENWLAEGSQKPVLLLLSGGSALKVLDHIGTDFFGPLVTVSMLDDRFTDNPEISNFRQYTKTAFHEKVTGRGAACFPTVPETGEDMETTASRIDRFLKTWKQDNPDGMIIALQGIGPDGHTAGIMPYPDESEEFRRLFVETDKWYTGYDAGDKSPLRERLTATIPFIRQLTHSVVFAVGNVKKRALTDALSSTKLNEVPGAVIRELRHVVLVTDQEVGI